MPLKAVNLRRSLRSNSFAKVKKGLDKMQKRVPLGAGYYVVATVHVRYFREETEEETRERLSPKDPSDPSMG